MGADQLRLVGIVVVAILVGTFIYWRYIRPTTTLTTSREMWLSLWDTYVDPEGNVVHSIRADEKDEILSQLSARQKEQKISITQNDRSGLVWNVSFLN